MLKRFNCWYDGLKEPWRFLFFLVALMGWVPVLWFIAHPVATVVGAAWMTCVAALALSRIR